MRQNTFYYLFLAFLCASIVHISPARAQQAGVEVIAISRAAASFDAQNLALGKAKGAVLRVPSNKADGARLIDGNPTGGWRAAEEFDAARPVEIVIRLTEESEVAQVCIQPKNWRPGSRIPKEVEILLSLTGPDSGFESVGRFTLHKKKAWQRLSFESRKAGYLKLRILSLYRDGRPGIGEIAVFGLGAGPDEEVSKDNKTVEDKPKFSSILVNHEAQNKAIRLGVHTYKLVDQFLGNPAPDESQFLIIRAFLGNRSAKLQASVPDVQKAFFLRLAGSETIDLHPISKNTALPFWGPILLEPGEELPAEMVFAVPARPLEQATLRHISNMGPISVYVIGEQPTLPSTYLAGPASKGQAKIAVERINFESVVGGKTAPEGRRYLMVTFWFTNTRPLQPLETDLAGLTVLVEDGYYVYAPVTKSRSPDLPQGETFYAQEPTPGEMVFLVPDKTGDLALVHFTKEGPLSLDLTPKVGALEPQQPVAGPVGKHSISMSLFQPQHAIQLEPPKAGLRYVVLDVGLRLNVDDPIASFAFEATKTLELHDGRGQFYEPEKVSGRLRRPLGPSDLWRDQLVRGEVAFLVPAEASSFTLVIPFKAGPTRLPVPKTLLSPPTTTIASKRLPTSTPSPGGKASKPGPDSRPKDPVSELLQKADSLFERGQYTTPEDRNALALYRQVLELDPGNRRAREKLDAMAAMYRKWAESAFRDARYEQATEYYQTLRVIQPGDAEADRRLAEIERRQARRAAEELYRRIMRTVEETFESLKARRWKEAVTRSTVTVDLADRLVEDHPDHPDTQVVFHLARSLHHMARAASFLSEGKQPEAKDEAEMAIQSSRQAAATATRERLRQMAKDYLRRAEAIRKLAEKE